MSFVVESVEHESDLRNLLEKQVDLLAIIADRLDDTKDVRLMGPGSKQVGVNESGELHVTSGPYDLAKFNELAATGTGYNFFGPKGREQFVITGFLMYGDKQVGTSTNATVIIYETDQPDSATANRVLVQVEVGQNQSIPFPNIRILCNKGVYINAQTDDDDIHMTIFGHYVDLNGQGETNG